jgi:hypothetical protein
MSMPKPLLLQSLNPTGKSDPLGTIPNREQSIRKLVGKLGPAEQLRACYEAGPTGYVLYWQLTALGVKSDGVAPTLIPVKSVPLAPYLCEEKVTTKIKTPTAIVRNVLDNVSHIKKAGS